MANIKSRTNTRENREHNTWEETDEVVQLEVKKTVKGSGAGAPLR